MRKLFIILVGLIAVVTFIRAFDNFGNFHTKSSVQVSKETIEEIMSEVFSSDSEAALAE